MPKVDSSHADISNSLNSNHSNTQIPDLAYRIHVGWVIACWMGAVCLSSLCVTPTVAQETSSANGDKPSIAAIQIEQGESVDLDGRVNESFWRRETPASGFLQENPNEGADATEVTEVYVAYDSDNLYIGAVLHDSDPDGIIAYQKERDAFLMTDDRFMWILDTFLDGRTGYFFEINPAGLMGDGLLGGGGGHRGGGGGGGGGGMFGGFGVNKSWDGIWEARVDRNGDGWSAEIRIPFRTLNFNPEQDTWGINFQRTVRRKQEESRWTGYRRNQQFTRPVHAGRLTGLQGMSQGIGLEAVPYALAGWRHMPNGEDDTDYPVDAGIDVSYNITPSLRAAATVNTDFAEVESDERRVNLTRFPLFFPEKRDFFLEGSGVYSFSPRSGVTPYFSRNIGLYEGEPVPVLYGGRLGGQIGRNEIGVVHVHTDSDVMIDDTDTTQIQPEDFTVVRVKRTIGEQSTIGAMYTRRATAADEAGNAPIDRHTIAADVDFFTSRFLGDKNFQFEAFFVGHTNPVEQGTSWLEEITASHLTARGIRINYPNDVWQIHTSYREIGDGFDPAVGFTRRTGLRRVQPTVMFAPRPKDLLGIRQLRWRVQFEYLMNMDWTRETQKTDITLLGLNFHSGDWFNFEVTHLRDSLDFDFEIHDGVTVPMGDYETLSWQAFIMTASNRKLSTRLRASGGEFWSGTKKEYSVDLTFRPVPGISLETEYEWNSVSLPQGDFTTNVIRTDAKWQMSPWMSFTNNVQYDDVTDIVGLFAKFRWIITPGSELFLVYTHNWQNMDDALFDRFRLTTLSQGATTKLNYTYRF